MKRKKFICLILVVLIIILSINIKSYAVTPTLEQIANAFNNCKTVKEMANSGSGDSFLASSNGKTLTITSVMSNVTTEVQYSLDGNILSTTLAQDNIVGAMACAYLIDSIGQLQGYEDGELLTTLNSEEIMNYTIDNQGFEIKQLDDGKVSTKVDITKKIPLIDTSNVYIEVSDLQDLKNSISGDGSAEKSKGNIWFDKSGYDGENILLIAEKDNLTENTYKSILSIVEVMFDSSKASNYFKTNYSGMSVGNKEFTGFKIEINPTKTEWEEKLIPADSGCEFVRITIDKSEASKAFTNSASTIETTNSENKVANISVMPRTGEIQSPFLIVLYVLITVTIIGIFTLIVTRKKA